MSYLLLFIILLLLGIIAYLFREIYHLHKELEYWRQADIERDEQEGK